MFSGVKPFSSPEVIANKKDATGEHSRKLKNKTQLLSHVKIIFRFNEIKEVADFYQNNFSTKKDCGLENYKQLSFLR